MVIALVSAGEAAAQVAKFRVTDVKQNRGTAAVTIAWQYNAGSGSGYTGKGVKLYLHDTSPGYGSAAKGTLVDTVDMKNGTGMHTIKLNTKSLKLKPGQSLVLTGVWRNNHQWGTDSNRPGGNFRLPARATRSSNNRHRASAGPRR